MDNIITAVTHSGPFHADDVFAAALLSLVLPQVRLVRTRDPQVLATADIVFDVGAVHDPATGRFDHHQQGFCVLHEDGTKLSSFGLLWQVYGEAACEGLVEVEASVRKGLVKSVDALDNGQGERREDAISLLIHNFNPCFGEGSDFDAAFAQVVEVAKAILSRAIAQAKGEFLAKAEVRKALGGRIVERMLVLEGFLPWQDTVIDEAPEVDLVVYPSGGQWMVQAVPPEKGSFAQKLPLPAAWAGLRDQAIVDLTGVQDAIFCHVGRFICGAQSRDGAIRLAAMALGICHQCGLDFTEDELVRIPDRTLCQDCCLDAVQM